MKDLNYLYIDIETAPALAAVFSLGEQRIGHGQLLEDTSIFMIQWAWNDGPIHTKAITDFRGYKKDWRDDSKLVNHIVPLLNKADVVVGQNSKRFDEKWLKARILKYGHDPVGGYVSHDTLISSRKHFRLTSHKLDYLAQYLGFEGKVHTDWSWWFELVTSSKDKDFKTFEKRIELFRKYGKKDVDLLRKVYKKMIPYCPELSAPKTPGADAARCECGGINQKWGTRFVRTQKQAYQRYRCNQCGKISQGSIGLVKKLDKLV